MKFSFGKFKGSKIDGHIPTEYLSWVISYVKNFPDTVVECKKELRRRGIKLRDIHTERKKLEAYGVYSKTGEWQGLPKKPYLEDGLYKDFLGTEVLRDGLRTYIDLPNFGVVSDDDDDYDHFDPW